MDIATIDLGDTFRVDYDGFEGEVIGFYQTREGKDGVVMQQLGTKVVHVYNVKRLEPLGENR
jgi:hypothetical protein